MSFALKLAMGVSVWIIGLTLFLSPSRDNKTTIQPAVVLSVESESHFLSDKTYDVVVENSKTKARSSFTSSDGVSASYNKGDKVSVEYRGNDAIGFSDK